VKFVSLTGETEGSGHRGMLYCSGLSTLLCANIPSVPVLICIRLEPMCCQQWRMFTSVYC